MMFGQIELEKFEGISEKSLTQKVASACSAVETSDLVGVSYKPLLYVGKQQVRGVNYVFIAEQTLVTNPPARKLVLLAINEYGGKFELVPSSIVEII